MRAFSTASGAVMFVPDQIKRKKRSISYESLKGEATPQETQANSVFWGWIKRKTNVFSKAA